VKRLTTTENKWTDDQRHLMEIVIFVLCPNSFFCQVS